MENLEEHIFWPEGVAGNKVNNNMGDTSMIKELVTNAKAIKELPKRMAFDICQ